MLSSYVHQIIITFSELFQKGDVVLVRRMSVGEGWWEGELNGKRGLFPSSYVKLVSCVCGVYVCVCDVYVCV